MFRAVLEYTSGSSHLERNNIISSVADIAVLNEMNMGEQSSVAMFVKVDVIFKARTHTLCIVRRHVIIFVFPNPKT
jgi:hypothetical protein